jgi:glycosyltransferase involved in cell wall biosynthesis
LEQPYKGVDVLIRAVAKCLGAGIVVRLTVVGDGRYRAPLETLAKELGISGSINLMGQLPSKPEVRNALDDADLFVLASRTEGLPRAMLEAMARALPCIGTRVGGIPELLDDDDLVDPDDADGLASKIRQVVADPNRMFQMSERNLRVSRDYSADILNARRKQFFEHVRKVTEQWSAN